MSTEVVDARLVFSNEDPEFDASAGAFVVDVQNDYNDIDLQFGQDIDARMRFDRVSTNFEINRNTDFEGNQLINFRVENQSAAPGCTGTDDGRMYYNTTDDDMYFCNGSAWENILREVADDPTPQLGGDLDVNDNAIVSDSGNLLIDNTNTTGATQIQLGTDTADTDFQVLNDSGTTLFEVDGSGNVSATGTVDLTGAEISGTTVLVFEGSSVDGVETNLVITDPQTSDKTITVPDRTGTISLSGDTFTGDVTGTLSATGTTSLTIEADSVALGTDTTGNYVATLADAGSGDLTITNGVAEGGAATIDIADDAIDFTEISDSLTLDAATDITAGAALDLTIGNNVTLVTSGTGTITANDVEPDTVALTTDTTGNYVQSLADAGAGDLTITNGVAEGGAATIDIADDAIDFTEISDTLTLDAATSIGGGVTLNFLDNTNLAVGTGSDLQFGHDGTDSSIVSAIGNLVIDNTNATGATQIQLGTDTSATDFQVLNDSGTTLFEVDGAGTATSSGNLVSSGTVDFTGAEITGTNALVFEGSAVDGVETIFEITNPTTTDKTITFKDETGTVALLSDISSSNTLDALTDTDISGVAGGHILVYDGTDTWDNQAVSGDLNIDNTGAATIQADSVALTTDTTGNYVQSLADAGAGDLTITNGATEGGAATIDIADDALDFTELADSLTLDAATDITAGAALDLTIGNNVTLVTTGTGTITANDVEPDTVALTTDTTGNYVQSLADAGSGDLTITNGVAEGGAATIDIADDAIDFTEIADSLTLDAATSVGGGVTLNFLDNTTLAVGTGNDLQFGHNGTNSIVTSTTGNLVIDNTNTTGATQIQLGTDTNATDFQVLNDTGTTLFEVDGSGNVSTTGTVDLTGAEISGTNALVFEGSGVDGVETIFEITNPTTSDKTITFKDESGTVAYLSDVGPNTLTGLNDTDISGVAGGHILVYDGTDTWDNQAVSGDLNIDNTGAATIQADSVALTTDTTGNYVQSLADAGSGDLTITNGATEGGAATIDIADDAIDFTEIADSLTLDAATDITAASALNLTIGNNVTLVTTGTGTITANDVEPDTVALTTDTTGNYVQSLADAGSGDLTITNGATEGGNATIDIADDAIDFTEISDTLTLDAATSVGGGVTLNFLDNTTLAVGTGNDLQFGHNGTNSTITSATGNLLIDNTNATGTTQIQLGTDTNATSLEILNDSGTVLLAVDANGAVGIGEAGPTEELQVNGDLAVGAGTETIADAGFSLDGDDVFIADSLGVEGAIYTDDTATKFINLDIHGGVRQSASAGTVASGLSPVLSFNQGNDSSVAYAFPVPDDWVSGTDIIVDTFWSPDDNTTGAIDFDMEYDSVAVGETISAGGFTDAIGGATFETVNTNTELDIYEMNATMPAATFAADDMVNIKLSRTPGDAGDTYANGINIHMVRISYTGKKLR